MDRASKVLVFSTPTCPHCNTAKQHLKRNRIRFKDIDVSKDHKAARDLQRKTGQTGVPVIFVDNKPIIGFDKAKLNKMLNIRN